MKIAGLCVDPKFRERRNNAMNIAMERYPRHRSEIGFVSVRPVVSKEFVLVILVVMSIDRSRRLFDLQKPFDFLFRAGCCGIKMVMHNHSSYVSERWTKSKVVGKRLAKLIA